MSEASVLILAASGSSGALSILLTQRAETVDHHRGQFAFPGGRCEGVGAERETCVETALREAEEEVGILPAEITVWGAMPSLATVTGFQITPVVATSGQSWETLPLKLQASEIAATFWVSFEELEREGVYRRERVKVGAVYYPVHVYQIAEKRVWGATAAILKNLLDRLHALR